MISPGQRTAVVVGAGIQGLLTVLALREKGFAVRVHAAGADPRSGGLTRSSTSDGEAIRLITPLEGCPYVGHAADSPEIAGIFEKPYSQGGWLGRAPTADDADWLSKRQVAWRDRDRVAKAVDWYVQATRRAMALWHKIRASHPRAFDHAEWLPSPVLRLYSDAETALTALEVHHKLGIDTTAICSPQTDPSDSEILRGHPWLGEAWQNGRIGGAFSVGGIALNIKQFVRSLIDDLERQKVDFIWHSECERVTFDNTNHIKELKFTNGTVSADNYVITPGVIPGENCCGRSASNSRAWPDAGC
ncbi:MAG: FAD-dependent oxidoreductase [Tepidisphaeraceae bacterium]